MFRAVAVQLDPGNGATADTLRKSAGGYLRDHRTDYMYVTDHRLCAPLAPVWVAPTHASWRVYVEAPPSQRDMPGPRVLSSSPRRAGCIPPPSTVVTRERELERDGVGLSVACSPLPSFPPRAD